MYTHGGFMLIYGKHNMYKAIILQLKINKFLKNTVTDCKEVFRCILLTDKRTTL